MCTQVMVKWYVHKHNLLLLYIRFLQWPYLLCLSFWLQKLPVTIEEYVNSTPQYLENGTIIVGEKKKIVYRVDAGTGEVISTFPIKFENDVILRNHDMGDQLKSSSANIQTSDLLFITRTDYKLESYFLDSNEVVWNMTTSVIDFQYRCSGFRNTFNELPFDSRLGLEYQGDEMPFSCHTKGVVYRTREHNPLHIELGFLESRHEDEMLFLPAAQTQSSHVSNIVDGIHMSPNQLGKETDDGKQIVPKISHEVTTLHQRNMLFAISIFIVGVALSFIVLGVVILCRRQKQHAKSNKQPSDLNEKQTSNAKRRKVRKLENSKNNASPDIQDGHVASKNKEAKVNKLTLAERNDMEQNDGGRQVGKIFVSNKEIAKGSNGTVVFEGVYDGRIQVAVKRLVLAHNDVAFKEYDNLIASKQHQNIVRWYGVEQDLDFFYLPLERCTCNLNDLIELYSDAFSNLIPAENPASDNINEYKVRLKSIKGIDNDSDLWQANGYPSSKLLNLMRLAQKTSLIAYIISIIDVIFQSYLDVKNIFGI